MNNERILITGGCGFAGSNLALKLRSDYPKAKIIAFDNLKRRGSELNVQRLKDHGVDFIHGDIRVIEDFNEVGEISVLIEAAAEPSVLSGLDSTPDYVINTNLFGTVNCLNYARKYNARFIFLSTSRVYPIERLKKINIEENESRLLISGSQTMLGVSELGINENFSLEGARSFYGTSKLASEQFIQEYIEFYGMKAIINRCGVLTGPWQMGKVDQGVIVLWLARHFWKGELNYIGFGGKGKQVRDILHIDDLYRLLKIQLNDFDRYQGEIFNVGGGDGLSVSLKELTSLCEEITGNRIKINSVLENRAADVPVYVTDNSKINSFSGWKPQIGLKDTLKDIFDWMNNNQDRIKSLLN